MTEKTPTVLMNILARKREEITQRSTAVSIQKLKSIIQERSHQVETAPRGFIAALNAKIAVGDSAVIAEVKKASPSKGVIREHFIPSDIARSYQQGGAACLSVLTDKDYFQGHEDCLIAARANCRLPVIRKDFIIDDYQVYESRAIDADCILLIVAAFMNDVAQLRHLYDLASSLGMDVLVEVHNQAELEVALTMNLSLIGINNRNLHNFETSLNNTLELLPLIDESILVVTESGIHTRENIDLMRSNNVHGFLVGEAFMRANDPGKELQRLFYE